MHFHIRFILCVYVHRYHLYLCAAAAAAMKVIFSNALETIFPVLKCACECHISIDCTLILNFQFHFAHTNSQHHTMENGNENEVTLKSLFRIYIFRYKVADWLFANSSSIWFDQATLFPIARLSYKYYMEIRASISSRIRNSIRGIAIANERLRDRELSMQFFFLSLFHFVRCILCILSSLLVMFFSLLCCALHM